MKLLNYITLTILVFFSSCAKSPEDTEDELVKIFMEMNNLLEQVDSKEKFKEIEPKLEKLHSDLIDIGSDIDKVSKEGLSEEKKAALEGVALTYGLNAMSKKKYGYDASKYDGKWPEETFEL